MKKAAEFLLYAFIRFLLSLRYRIKIKGKKQLLKENFLRKGGILFLANHTAEIDPLILISALWFPFRPHPVAIDYLFRKPFVRMLLNFVGAFPIPNLDASSNSYKRKEIEKTFGGVISALDRKENFLIYPSGGLKSGAEEIIGGASGTAKILEVRPQLPVVLVRTTGLWGSSFSRAPTGKTPDLGSAFWSGFKVLFRNGLFFAPRREVGVEFLAAPKDFPRAASRLELNRYLEKWYNKEGPEPLNLVSFSRFRKVVPKIFERTKEERVYLENIPQDIQERVIDEIGKLTRIPRSQITPQSTLAQDLGLDSLDMAQLVVSVKEQFGIPTLNSTDLTTVATVMAFAAKQRKSTEEENGAIVKKGIWGKETRRPPASFSVGKTIPEVFFTTCERMKHHIACVDLIAGEITYNRLKIGVVLFAEAIRKMPGEHIGIMMPASVAVNALIVATMLAGKIPVMINWTLGERNLRSVIERSGIKMTLSSWNFLNRLDNVELDGLDDQLVFLEDLRSQASLKERLKAFFLSRKKGEKIIKAFQPTPREGQDTAVVLFTSGTESFPKGVPLTHENLLANQRGAYSLAQVRPSDVLLGALPSFHSFGFSVTGLFPLLAGLRVAYTPNPTDGKKLAEAIERWQITLLCLAPTFLKNLLRVGNEKQLRTLRLVVAGAEKTAPEIYTVLNRLNREATLIEGYGITECAPILTLNPPDEPPQGVGKALPEVEIAIVHPETYQAQPIATAGLILARGPNIFKGYLDPKQGSPFKEHEGKLWYITGDLGYLDERGYLTLSGRLKRFVKIGGEMVSLTAIEETLLQILPQKGWPIEPDAPTLAVSSVELEGKKGEIHLFTILDLGVTEANQALRESGMSNIIKIRSVKKLPFIPLLGTGKIDYRRLSSILEKN